MVQFFGHVFNRLFTAKKSLCIRFGGLVWSESFIGIAIGRFRQIEFMAWIKKNIFSFGIVLAKGENGRALTLTIAMG